MRTALAWVEKIWVWSAACADAQGEGFDDDDDELLQTAKVLG